MAYLNIQASTPLQRKDKHFCVNEQCFSEDVLRRGS